MNFAAILAETDIWQTLEEWFSLQVLVIIFLGIPIVYLASRLVFKMASRRLSEQAAVLLRRGVFYSGLFVLFIMLLNQLGYTLTALLGAAGIFGIAIGFASQTSLSNIISGFFLISERPFSIGDVIEVGTTRGVVLSIDLLSVKLRTFDNKMVRIPNENLIKAEVTNITRYPIRRLDIKIGVAYKEDVSKVRTVLMNIAQENPNVLEEPEPLVIFTEFGSSSLDFLYAVWVSTPDFIKVKNEVMQEIKERFDREKIEIPFPHVTIYTGSVTDPFPLKMVQTGSEAEPLAKQGLHPAR